LLEAFADVGEVDLFDGQSGRRQLMAGQSFPELLNQSNTLQSLYDRVIEKAGTVTVRSLLRPFA
jgi:hypothetical protein